MFASGHLQPFAGGMSKANVPWHTEDVSKANVPGTPSDAPYRLVTFGKLHGRIDLRSCSPFV